MSYWRVRADIVGPGLKRRMDITIEAPDVQGAEVRVRAWNPHTLFEAMIVTPGEAPECSVCRQRHGREIEHACE